MQVLDRSSSGIVVRPVVAELNNWRARPALLGRHGCGLPRLVGQASSLSILSVGNDGQDARRHQIISF